MAIVIQQILGSTAKGIRARVDHSGTRLDAEVALPPSEAAAAVGQSLMVEIDYAAVTTWRTVDVGSDRYGLFQDDAESGSVRIVGSVHDVIPLDDGTSLIDVYLQAGPEFVNFPSSAFTGKLPRVGECIAVTVRGLCFLPRNRRDA